MTTRNTLSCSIVLGAALTCLCSAAAFAGANPNTYLDGTYVLVNFDANGPESDSVVITFNGAGTYSGTDINNSAGTITTSPVSGTYSVASNGSFTTDAGTSQTATGVISADGNTFLATKVSSIGEEPAILIGIKQ